MDDEAVFKNLRMICDELEGRLSKKEIKGKSITLKIKYKDFSVFTRSKTQEVYYENADDFFETVKKLWELRPYDKPIRLLGVSLSNLNTEEKKNISVQLKIDFPDYEY